MNAPTLLLPAQSLRCRCLIQLFRISIPIYRFFFKRSKRPWRRTLDEMRNLPPGTLGGALGRFWSGRGLRPIPCFEDHDALHVLLDFPTEVPGECAMQWYLLGNGKRSPYVLGVIALSLFFLPEYLSVFLDALRQGRRRVSVWDWPFESLLDEELGVLQQRLGRPRPEMTQWSFAPLIPWRYLLALSAFCVLLVAIRPLFGIGEGGIRSFHFLIWNLFLAWVPLIPLLVWRRSPSGWTAWLSGGLSLLFLPNAFYLFTDILHFRPGRGLPSHFETLLFFAFATAGLLLGLYALRWWQLVLRLRLSSRAAEGVMILVSFAAGAGVWLGRLLRWNSWDVFYRPKILMEDLGMLLFGETFVPFVALSGFTGLFIFLAQKATGHRLIT